MELKIIPAPLYKDKDGIPAYKSGEWPGIKPNHFERTCLMVRQIRKNIDYERKLSYKHIPEKRSKEYNFRPSVKLVNSYLKSIKNNRHKNYINKERKQNIDSFKSASDNYDDNIFFGKKRNKDKIIANHSLILPKLRYPRIFKKINNFHSLSEINIGNLMNRKKRILSLEQQRNYYKLLNPGDKNYRYAEYSQDFFKEGELIPGSSNRTRISDNYNKIKNDIYKFMNLNVKSLDVNKIWNNKIKKEMEDNEIQYVTNLENWDNIHIKDKDDTKNDDKRKNQKKGKN